jgi:hypothetical protein
MTMRSGWQTRSQELRARRSGELDGAQVKPYLISWDTSVEAALKSVKLFEGICKGGCQIGSRFAVQRFGLD